jgi:hypothetical protein
LAVLAGLAGGMYAGVELANFVTDPKNKLPDRKLGYKDALANIDDAFGALILAKFPCVNKLPLEKTLPFIFAWCGYRAGKSN